MTQVLNNDSSVVNEINIFCFFGSYLGEVRLTSGSYSYPFEFEFPKELPTSFEGSIGYIRYKMTVVIDNNSMWRDKEFDIPFSVVKAIDLNSDPVFRVIWSFYNRFLLCFWNFVH